MLNVFVHFTVVNGITIFKKFWSCLLQFPCVSLFCPDEKSCPWEHPQGTWDAGIAPVTLTEEAVAQAKKQKNKSNNDRKKRAKEEMKEENSKLKAENEKKEQQLKALREELNN